MNGIVTSIGLVLALIFLGTEQLVAQPVPPSAGLVGWWRGETNALDSSTRANHGTLVASPTFDTGIYGKAFSFAGNGNMVRIPDTSDFWLSNSMSMAAWIFPKINSWQVLERESSTPGLYAFAFGMDGSSNLRFVIRDIAGNTEMAIKAPLQLNQWTHAGATLDHASGVMRLYINGFIVAETNTTVRAAGQINAPQVALAIGNSALNGGFPFVGLIDEAVLYSRALSLQEIRSLMTNAPPVQPTVAIGLFAGVTVSGESGNTYAIQYATNVNGPNWSNLTSITLTQSTQLWVDTSVNAGASPKRFYRAVLTP